MVVIKVNKRRNYHSPIYLSEVTRKNMVGKSKKQSPERYAKKANYHPLSYKGIDIFKLLDFDQLVIKVPVGKYECTIAYGGITKELETVLKSQAVPNVNLQTCIRVLQRSIDNKDILVDCTCPDFCLEENTPIKLLNGEVHTIKEIKEKFDKGEELWVYSTDENGDFKPGKVTDVWVSGQVNKMVKVTLDNGESIITTPNHRYMMRDGSYTVAEELKSGDSLMPLYFSYHNGYESVKLNTNPKAWVSVYKTVASITLSDEIEEAKIRSGEDIIAIHHSDYNKLNNYPTNLKPMGRLEHWNFHSTFAKSDTERIEKWKKAGREYWDSPEGRERKSKEMSQSIRNFWANMSESERKEYSERTHEWQKTEESHKRLSDIRKKYWENLDDETRKKRYKENSIRLNGENGEKSSKRKKEWWANATEEQLAHRREAYRETMKDRPIVTSEKKRIANSKNCSKIAKENHKKDAEIVLSNMIKDGIIINEENYNKYRKKGDPYFKTMVSYGLLEEYNHKVVSVEFIDYESPISVYDLTVDKYNNFFVNAGVILHNCYRFSYYASKFGYKYGELEKRPPKITNPDDSQGSVCKHLLALLSSKRWLVKVATQLNAIIRDNLELYKARLGLEDDEIFVNDSGVHSNTTAYRLRQARKDADDYFANRAKDNADNGEDSEEITDEEPNEPVVVDMSDDLDIDDSVEEEYLKGRIENGLTNS